MSDVCVVKPIFHRDRLVAFSATTAYGRAARRDAKLAARDRARGYTARRAR